MPFLFGIQRNIIFQITEKIDFLYVKKILLTEFYIKVYRNQFKKLCWVQSIFFRMYLKKNEDFLFPLYLTFQNHL